MSLSWTMRRAAKYFTPVERGAYTLLLHPNGNENEIDKIEWKHKPKVIGKKKRGSIALSPSSILATVLLKSGDVEKLRLPVAGQLIELNELLDTAPSLLLTDNLGRGWIAILQIPTFAMKALLAESAIAMPSASLMEPNERHDSLKRKIDEIGKDEDEKYEHETSKRPRSEE